MVANMDSPSVFVIFEVCSRGGNFILGVVKYTNKPKDVKSKVPKGEPIDVVLINFPIGKYLSTYLYQ